MRHTFLVVTVKKWSRNRCVRVYLRKLWQN